MSKFALALGAAALAITAPALAQHGGGNGGGKGGGQQHVGGQPGGGNKGSAKQGGGNGGGQMRADRGNAGPSMRQVDGNRGGGNRGGDQARGNGGGKFEKSRGNDRIEVARGKGGNDDSRRADIRYGGRNDIREGRDFVRSDNMPVLARNFGSFGGNYANCPPGLAKKDNGCLPPGQAQKYLGARIQQNYANSLIPYQYRSWYRDDGDHYYRYGDDTIYRISRNNGLVDGLIPLFGSAGYGGGYYALGDPWPNSYDFYNVPYQYRTYYDDGSDYHYRFGDGAIYRINSGSGLVDGIVALLAGDLGVGSRLPIGYDTYNVPFAFRDRYADSADNWYRYNDGYIYQVDPKTRLISAVIDAIV